MLEYIKINNFRNIIDERIEFKPNINLIVGDNGQGKTNLCEAIYYLFNVKSFRTNINNELINREKDINEFSYLEGTINKDIYRVLLNKTIQTSLNGKTIRKRSLYREKVVCYCFSPEDVYIFKDSPQLRRDLIDDELSRISTSYENNLKRYYQILELKSKLLKEENISLDILEIYNQKIVELSIFISDKRRRFVDKLNGYLKIFFNKLEDANIDINLIYQSRLLDCDANSFTTLLHENMNKEIEAKTSLYGVHRDDYILTLNGDDVSKYGSQGQNRIAALALKLSLIALSSDLFKKEELIILDDVLSELDYNHQLKLLNLLKDKEQIFISSVKELEVFNDIKSCVNVIEIKGGKRI